MARTVLVGLIGAKIQHSLSPALFEEACAARGLRGHYHLMDLDLLRDRSLPELLAAARAADFAGVNITFPCKEAVLPLLDEVAGEAARIGAVNTVTFGRDRRAVGHNTDSIGFRRAIEETFGTAAVAGASVLLVGAGGAGRAVAAALLQLGVRDLRVSDRSHDQAAGLVGTLAQHFDGARCSIVADPGAEAGSVGGIVNATPVGMAGIPGLPMPVDGIGASHWVADVIYSPLETEFLTAARQRGARVMGGGAMCVHQAAEAFRLFTGEAADTGQMQRTFAAAAARRTVDRVVAI